MRRKKERSKQGQTNKQGRATQQSLFLEKMSCSGGTRTHDTLYMYVHCSPSLQDCGSLIMPVIYTCTCKLYIHGIVKTLYMYVDMILYKEYIVLSPLLIRCSFSRHELITFTHFTVLFGTVEIAAMYCGGCRSGTSTSIFVYLVSGFIIIVDTQVYLGHIQQLEWIMFFFLSPHSLPLRSRHSCRPALLRATPSLSVVTGRYVHFHHQ